MGCSGPFLEGGDSGSLVFFHDKNNQKQVFAYGVCEVDEFLLPEQHESASSCCFDEDESESEQEVEDEKLHLRVLRLNVRMKKVNVEMDGKIKINWNVKKNE
jgi:hypothetical protein